MDLLFSFHDEGRTIIVITHNEEISALLPRELRLLDGQVVADTTRRVHAQ